MFRRLRSALIIQAEPLLMRFVRRWLVALYSEAHAELMRSFFAEREVALDRAVERERAVFSALTAS